MPVIHHVKEARPCTNDETLARREAAGIQVGQPYYWWTFYKSPPCLSRTRPRPSQLTRSKWRAVYAAQESIDDALDAADLLDALNAAVDSLMAVKDAYEDAAGSIETTFPSSPTAEQCREKALHLDHLVGELKDKLSPIEELVEGCQTCLGAGEVECDACDAGAGDDVCAVCSGTTAVKCTECPEDGSFNDIKQEVLDLDWDAPC